MENFPIIYMSKYNIKCMGQNLNKKIICILYPTVHSNYFKWQILKKSKLFILFTCLANIQIYVSFPYEGFPFCFFPKKAYCNKQLFPHHLCLYSPLFCFWSLPNWQHNYTNIPLCHPHFMSVVSTLFTRVDHSNWNLQKKYSRLFLAHQVPIKCC